MKLLPTLLLLLWGTDSLAAQDWQMVWSDEFDYAGLPDPAKWGYEVGYIRNQESQYYTESRLENARVEGGNLIIESRRENYQGFLYTSASLNTKNAASWTYGRIEVRAKLPTGKGMWPAIWMLGSNISEVGWPACGEIDIMENVGFDPDRIHANIHTQDYNHVLGTGKGSNTLVEAPYNQFHTYAVEWFEDRLDFYVDETRYFTYGNERTGWRTWPFDKPHYLILNAAVGGAWGNQQGIDNSIFPQKYYIDYVRVYKLAQEETFYFPRLGSGAFDVSRNLNLLSTELILTNAGGAAEVSIDFFDDSGAGLWLDLQDTRTGQDCEGTSCQLVLPSHHATALVTREPGVGELSSGYVRISVQPQAGIDAQQDPNVGGTLVFARHQRVSERDVLLYETGVPLSSLLTSFSLFLDSIGDRDTGLALVNPPWDGLEPDGELDAELTIDIWDASSGEPITSLEVSLPPGQARSQFLWEYVSDSGQAADNVVQLLRETQALVTVRSSRPIAAMTLRQSNPESVFPEAVPALTAFPVISGT